MELRLRRAFARISAPQVQPLFNRIVRDSTLWTFRARGLPKSVADLLLSVRVALATEGFNDLAGHKPHVTISYRAPFSRPTVTIVPPITWVIDKVLLVKSVGTGDGYHYEPIAEPRSLRRAPQQDLFEKQ